MVPNDPPSASQSDQAIGCLIGSLAADALALGVHWIYDAAQLTALKPVADFTNPAPDSYHPNKRAGEVSHVGDQALALHRSLRVRNGFVAEIWSEQWLAMWPDYHDYVDKATKHRLAEGEAMASDELAGAARIAPLVAFYGPERREELFDAISGQTALTHAGVAVRSAGWCLAELALGAMETGSVAESLARSERIDYPELDYKCMLASAQELARKLPDDPIAAVGETGRACPLAQAFPAVLYVLLCHGDDLEAAFMANARAGGDNCARGLALGMVMGAAHGLVAVPERWRAVESLLG